MKNKVLINSLRAIKKMYPRFISLLLISLLGAFTFLGFESTSSSMIKSLDKYLDSANTYDIKVVSTLGLVDKDIEEIKNVDGVKDIEGSYSKDALLPIDDEEYVVNISSITTKLNTLTIKEGRLPTNNKEIVVEENLIKHNNLKIGDTLLFEAEDLANKNLTIVGIIDSTLYFNASTFRTNRGVTNIGTGTINYYSFAMPSLFKTNYYTSIYLTVEGAINKVTSKEDYISQIDNVIENINEIKENRQKERLESLFNELAESKIDFQNSLNEMKKDLNTYRTKFNNELRELGIFESQIKWEISKTNKSINDLKNQLKNIPDTDPNYSIYMEELDSLNQLLNRYNNLLSLKNTIEDKQFSINLFKVMSEKKIKEAEKYLNKVEPKWNIMDRTSYITYTEYIDDCGSILNLAQIFPLIFFALSILISLVSMNRMVEDDRQEIGTLKSLGFCNGHIMIKYLLFAFLATLIGGVVGSLLGTFILPKLIFNIYSILFLLPKLYVGLAIDKFILCLSILFICIIGTTYITVKKVVKEKPSELIRPKAPKNGKRIILEKWTFLWNKLSFSNKITIRNIFRYKKRAIVTICGIAGCTALMMSGFGLKDSIVSIPDRQFNNVYAFDAMVYVNNYKVEDEIIFEDERITSYISLQNINATTNGLKTPIFVVEDEKNMDNFLSLNDSETFEKKELEYNKIAITKKLAELENIKVGDYLEFTAYSNLSYKYQVSAIVENYIDHYIFMNESTYISSGEEFVPNVVCIQTIELDETEKDELSRSLLNNQKVFSISFISDMEQKVDNLLNTLDKVVLILIILASLLSFIVLYNLSNINIQERKREIATLKVLGFYHKEVDNYITNENLILTIIGIAIGLVIGYFLSMFFINTVEIEKMVFMRKVRFGTYFYSVLLTMFFTLIVNYLTHFILKKINMIESLKSVE